MFEICLRQQNHNKNYRKFANIIYIIIILSLRIVVINKIIESTSRYERVGWKVAKTPNKKILSRRRIGWKVATTLKQRNSALFSGRRGYVPNNNQ